MAKLEKSAHLHPETSYVGDHPALEKKEGSGRFLLLLMSALVFQTLNQGNMIEIEASGLCWPPGVPGGTSWALPAASDGASSSAPQLEPGDDQGAPILWLPFEEPGKEGSTSQSQRPRGQPSFPQASLIAL